MVNVVKLKGGNMENWINEIITEESPCEVAHEVKVEQKEIKKRKPKTNFWTKEEIQILMEKRQQGVSNREIADLLGKEICNVITKYNYIIKNPNSIFNDTAEKIKEAKNYISNHPEKTDKEIAKELNRSVLSIGRLRRGMGLKKVNYYQNTYKEYTPEEIEIIKNKDLTIKEISEKIGRSTSCIYMKRTELGITNKKLGRGKTITSDILLDKLKEKYGNMDFYSPKEIETAFTTALRS